MTKTWRDAALAVIQLVREEHPEAQGDELKALLHDAYPFGQRKYHPYKVWRECVREALGLPRKQKRIKDVSKLPLFEKEG